MKIKSRLFIALSIVSIAWTYEIKAHEISKSSLVVLASISFRTMSPRLPLSSTQSYSNSKKRRQSPTTSDKQSFIAKWRKENERNFSSKKFLNK